MPYTEPVTIHRVSLSGRGVQQGQEWGSTAAAEVAARRLMREDRHRTMWYLAAKRPLSGRFDITYLDH